MTFGEKVKIICEREGINLREFSDLSGIPYSSLRNYSNPKTQPSLKKIRQISEMPGLSKYKPILLDFVADGVPLDAHFKSLLDELDKSELDRVEEYAKFLLSQRKEDK